MTARALMPALRTIVIGCVDPRVDPELLLGAQVGEVAVIRNVGGRVTPGVLDELAMLRSVTQAAGGDLGAGWEVIVLQHTDCGITRLAGDDATLAGFLGVRADEVGSKSVGDPRAAVAHDVGILDGETRLGAGLRVSGMVYDVTTGLVDAVRP
ncbi:carbonic anhydrase [Williamsia herbipolensis]|uniref:carbonic anhydrase n=1 Tax=Williamsia herbipolensis TaxID=1603258 RepID=UPI0005F7EEE7|nr:carbonic anhydrase [Williamsia herbipolensis]